MSAHYVARVVVEKIERPEPTAARGYERNQVDPPKRTKTTVASIAVSSSTLLGVVENASKHLALVEAGGDIE